MLLLMTLPLVFYIFEYASLENTMPPSWKTHVEVIARSLRNSHCEFKKSIIYCLKINVCAWV